MLPKSNYSAILSHVILQDRVLFRTSTVLEMKKDPAQGGMTSSFYA
jgi:hypothetical protein